MDATDEHRSDDSPPGRNGRRWSTTGRPLAIVRSPEPQGRCGPGWTPLCSWSGRCSSRPCSCSAKWELDW